MQRASNLSEPLKKLTIIIGQAHKRTYLLDGFRGRILTDTDTFGAGY